MLGYTSSLQSIGQHLSALDPDGVGGGWGARKGGGKRVGSDFRCFAFAAGITARAAAEVKRNARNQWRQQSNATKSDLNKMTNNSITQIFCYLSSLASGLPCEGETTGVVCSFRFSSGALSPPPGSSE